MSANMLNDQAAEQPGDEFRFQQFSRAGKRGDALRRQPQRLRGMISLRLFVGTKNGAKTIDMKPSKWRIYSMHPSGNSCSLGWAVLE